MNRDVYIPFARQWKMFIILHARHQESELLLTRLVVSQSAKHINDDCSPQSMGHDEVTRIKHIFLSLAIHPEYLEHEAVITSEDAARTRGFPLKQGIKAILFTNDSNQWVVVDVPAHKKVDQKKVAEHMGWPKSKIRMATADEVMQKTGCEIGAVPPFGHKEQIPILVDVGIYENQESSFNIGLRTHSVKIKTELMKNVFAHLRAVEGSFAK